MVFTGLGSSEIQGVRRWAHCSKVPTRTGLSPRFFRFLETRDTPPLQALKQATLARDQKNKFLHQLERVMYLCKFSKDRSSGAGPRIVLGTQQAINTLNCVTGPIGENRSGPSALYLATCHPLLPQCFALWLFADVNTRTPLPSKPKSSLFIFNPL